MVTKRGEVECACGPVREEDDVDDEADGSVQNDRSLQLLLTLVELERNLTEKKTTKISQSVDNIKIR